MSKYKGESPAKKIARAFAWERTRDLLGQNRFEQGRHLVLAGKGGDISCIRALGGRNIVACDIDADACADVARRFTDVDVRHEDVGNAAVREHYDSLMLDFCGTISSKLVMLLQRVCFAQTHGRSSAPVLWTCFQMGREKREPAAISRPAWSLEETGSYSVLCDIEKMAVELDLHDEGVFLRNQSLIRQLGHLDYHLDPLGTLQYFSNTETQGGVPMFMCCFGLIRRTSEDIDRGLEARSRLQRAPRGALSYFEDAPALPLNVGSAKMAQRFLRDICTLSTETASLLAQRYSLDENQIRAWRAVATKQAKAAQQVVCH